MTKKTGKILIVDDDDDILVAGRLLLKRHYESIVTSNKPEFIPKLMAENNFDAIMLDMNFGPGESEGDQGFRWLESILDIDPHSAVVMITAHGDVNMAVEALKKGATDFITKPWQNERVLATLSASVKLKHSLSETDTLKKTNSTLAKAVSEIKQPMIGQSQAMKDVASLIDRTAPTDANVLILGENGTGKEIAARELHKKSKRENNVFMAVDLGSLTESLFESELFGHKKGSFTDAREDRIGRLQAAEGGTLFLDEIGNLPLHLQAKLLNVLEQRQVSPVGSDKLVPINIRVIAATNIPIEKLHDETIFRQDLLFRLNTVEITIPPLRMRTEDIPEIAKHYADIYCRKYGKPLKDFSTATMQKITTYTWPGNVRALKHALERAVILSNGEMFEPQDFPFDYPDAQLNNSTNTEDNNITDLNLERVEFKVIEKALKKHSYNISKTSKELGLTRAALYRRMEKHGL